MPDQEMKSTEEQRSAALIQRLKEIAAQAEATAPDGLRVAVFLYAPDEEGKAGEVAHVSRDRMLTAVALRRWLDVVTAPATKARA